MNWIEERIRAEQKKHYRITRGCDWIKIASLKIKGEFKNKIKELKENIGNEIFDMSITTYDECKRVEDALRKYIDEIFRKELFSEELE